MGRELDEVGEREIAEEDDGAQEGDDDDHDQVESASSLSVGHDAFTKTSVMVSFQNWRRRPRKLNMWWW